MPTTKSEHVGWLTFMRLVDSWTDLDEHDRVALQRSAEYGAGGLDGHVPAEPVAGWRSAAHSRDGKAYPCREHTNGARPAWIWKVTR